AATVDLAGGAGRFRLHPARKGLPFRRLAGVVLRPAAHVRRIAVVARTYRQTVRPERRSAAYDESGQYGPHEGIVTHCSADARTPFRATERSRSINPPRFYCPRPARQNLLRSSSLR